MRHRPTQIMRRYLSHFGDETDNFVGHLTAAVDGSGPTIFRRAVVEARQSGPPLTGPCQMRERGQEKPWKERARLCGRRLLT
jgi:hypothetical protein